MSAINTVNLAGALSSYLTTPADITFFHSQYKRHTPFSVESQTIDFTGGNRVVSGSTMRATLNRSGDLVSDLFLRVQLPALDGATHGWKNMLGYRLIKSISLSIGHSEVDKLYGYWMYVWAELTQGTDDKERDAVLAAGDAAGGAHELFVHIPFFFARHGAGGSTASALKLVSLQYHSVQVAFEPNDLKSLLVDSDGGDLADSDAGDIYASLQAQYVYLDVEERSSMAAGSFEQLISELQVCSGVSAATGLQNINIPFNHALQAIYVYAPPTGQYIANDQEVKVANTAVKSVQLKLNNQARFDSSVTPAHLHHIERRCHSGSREYQNDILVLPFALNPESPEPSGSLNFSRVDNAVLTVDLTGSRDVYVMARSHNLLRISMGLGGVAFAS